MNAPAVITKAALPALQMDDSELMLVLKNSLYPGAKEESIKLVINYCKAAGLDPMQKPVHIVPMSVSTGKKGRDGWDEKEMRDVVMPGIGLYRTQAARSGEYAGVTEPEFGEEVTEQLGELQISYPKWCRITVKRLLANGAIVEFSAKELWRENYATKSNKSAEPNAMWKKRPYAQLAKCAEAQALRKAFPEFGAQPTADEMEGKAFEGDTIDNSTGEILKKEPGLPPYPDDRFAENLPKWRKAILAGSKTAEQVIAMISSKGMLTEAQKAEITASFVTNTVVDAEFVAAMEGAE